MISDREILKLLGTWAEPFLGRFKSLTEVQKKSVHPILEGKDVLVASATASGKTEAIVVPMISRLKRLRALPIKPAIIMLIVAPTRALVNDLFKRLEGPVGAIGWKCGRQTSDYSEKRSRPHVLVTTPESFDSMLAHDIERANFEPVGHLLANVRALFLDEAHLYENSVRGEHVTWLVARLKRLKKFASMKGWVSDESVQVCAGSATISYSSELAHRLLGAKAVVIRAGGDREMRLYSPSGSNRWIRVESETGLEGILDILKPYLDTTEELSDFIWGPIKNASQDGLRKMLIFVPSRKMSDFLSASLSSSIGNRRNMYVSGHHGSLEKSKREEAEKMFSERRDSVLVATSTLEVGVDIGDVDVIVLYGVPPDTSSLLQRIGRGGRRSGLIQLVPIAQDEIELAAFGSMLLSACTGSLEKSPPGRRWSVFVQQIVSMIMQSGGKGRKAVDMLDLVEAVWGKSALGTAQSVIDHLVAENLLTMSGNRLLLGEKFSDDLQNNRAYYHCNFETSSNTIPVVDRLTGETIGHVKPELGSSNQVAIAGHSVDVVYSGDQLLVRTRKAQASNTFEYDSRRPAVSKSFAEHVRRGLGFDDEDTLVVETENMGPLWFHFGGELYEWIFQKILGVSTSSKIRQRGLALNARVSEDELRNLGSTLKEIHEAIEGIGKRVAYFMGVGRFHKYLPEQVKTEVTMTMFDVDSFLDWSASRRVRPVSVSSKHWVRMNAVINLMCKTQK